MSTTLGAFPFNPDAVSFEMFPAVIESADPRVQGQLLVTPYFGFLAPEICDVTDIDVLCEVQELMIEPIDNGQSFASGLWTVPEVVGYVNQRQNDFLKQTQIIMRRQRLDTIPETHRFDLPQDCILLRRILFRDSDPNSRFCVPVARGDTFELDMAQRDWEYNNTLDIPRVYSDTEAHQLGIEVGPGFMRKGVLEALYVPLGVPLGNTGICLTIPGEFAPALRWGVLEDMLRKHGRAQDPGRADYCKGRWNEGVAAANLMLSGWA